MKINRRNDYAFKRIFGHEDTKDILARFLTVVLEVNIEPEEISLIHTELSPEFLQAKESVLDIQVRRSSCHEKLAIEMQLQDEGNIERRILHYWGRSYTEELKAGQDYNSLPRTINIVIVNFDVFKWNDAEKFHSVFQILERSEGVLFCDALEIHMLELPKLRRQPIREEMDAIAYWGIYLNNTEGEVMERIAEKEPMIAKAMSVEEIFAKDESERYFYNLREKGLRDFDNAMITAEKRGELKGISQGRTEGIRQGRTEGKIEGKRDTARSMLAHGMLPELISEITGLSIKDIETLRAE